jgi:hypothetical protein
MMMVDAGQRDDGTRNRPGEQIRSRDEHENADLDNLRGGADPSGGRSREVPRDNSKAGPAADADRHGHARERIPPGSPSGYDRPSEENLAGRGENKNAPSDGGDK